jgi:hypothetical protein
VALRFEGGAPAAIPAEPRNVRADPIPGGKVRVTWYYCPWQEVNGPGAAYEARIYWDNATGTVDYASPHATVSMGGPSAEAEWEWTSGVLTDDQEYRFVVRIATAAHPAGIETQNKDEHPATPDSSVPAAPALAAEVVADRAT